MVLVASCRRSCAPGSAALALGLIETFGSARGRRGAGPARPAAGVVLLLVLRPPLRAGRARHGGRAHQPPHRRAGGAARRAGAGAAARPRPAPLPAARPGVPPGKSSARRRRGALPVRRGPVAGGGDDRALRARSRRAWRRWPGGCPRTWGAISSSRWSTACCTGRWPATPCARSSATSGSPIQDEIQAELAQLLGATACSCAASSWATSICRRSTGSGSRACWPRSWPRQKMKYTLELKEKKVSETRLEAEAAKVQREKAAEAAGARGDHRRQGQGRGDETRAAAQGEGDRAAPAGGRGAQDPAHQGRRGRGRGAPDRVAAPRRTPGASCPTPTPTASR